MGPSRSVGVLSDATLQERRIKTPEINRQTMTTFTNTILTPKYSISLRVKKSGEVRKQGRPENHPPIHKHTL